VIVHSVNVLLEAHLATRYLLLLGVLIVPQLFTLYAWILTIAASTVRLLEQLWLLVVRPRRQGLVRFSLLQLLATLADLF